MIATLLNELFIWLLKSWIIDSLRVCPYTSAEAYHILYFAEFDLPTTYHRQGFWTAYKASRFVLDTGRRPPNNDD